MRTPLVNLSNDEKREKAEGKPGERYPPPDVSLMATAEETFRPVKRIAENHQTEPNPE
jgi:hypothetical protein